MPETPASFADPGPQAWAGPPANIPPPSFLGRLRPPPAYPPPPGYAQPAQPPAAAGLLAGGAGALLYQFGGPALASVIAGVLSIAMPFVAQRYFIVLPIAGLLSGVRALQRGRPVGGAVGIGVNIVGGLVSLFASGLLGG